MRNEFDLDDLKAILNACPEYSPDHPLGRPFMSGFEGAFISHQNINEFLFDNNGSPVGVSSGLNGPGHSIFRLRTRR